MINPLIEPALPVNGARKPTVIEINAIITIERINLLFGYFLLDSWATPISIEKNADAIDEMIKTNHNGLSVIPKENLIQYNISLLLYNSEIKKKATIMTK